MCGRSMSGRWNGGAWSCRLRRLGGMAWRRVGLGFLGASLRLLLPPRPRLLLLRVRGSLLLRVKSLLPTRPRPLLLSLFLRLETSGPPTTATILPSKHCSKQTRCRRRWRLRSTRRSERGRRNCSKGRYGAEYEMDGGSSNNEANMRVTAEGSITLQAGGRHLLYSYPRCWVRRFNFLGLVVEALA